MQPQGWWLDWRVWAPLAGVAIVVLLDVATPGTSLNAYLVIPVAASALAGRPWLTAAVGGVALAATVALAVTLDYTGTDLWRRLLLMALAGVVSTVLAALTGRADRLRRESETRYRLLADNSADVVVQSDRDGSIEFVSPAVKGLLGYEPAELVGRSARDLMHPDDLGEADLVLDAVRHGGELDEVRARLRRKDGSYVWVGRTGRLLRGDDGQVVGAVASWRDVEAQVAATRELERWARYDDLTGVLNRREALSLLDHMLQGHRMPGTLSAVLFVDVDAFKDVNDTHGHAAGDAVLRSLTTRIQHVVRDTDVVARLGGDEFAVFLAGLHDEHEAVGVAEKVLSAMRVPVETPDGEVPVSVSIGVGLFMPGETADAVLARADAAMYAAKAAGRDRVVLLARPTAGDRRMEGIH